MAKQTKKLSDKARDVLDALVDAVESLLSPPPQPIPVRVTPRPRPVRPRRR